MVLGKVSGGVHSKQSTDWWRPAKTASYKRQKR